MCKRITIFTPTYNRAHTLWRVYDSLSRQSHKGFKWLIIDDGSTDTTSALVKQWIIEDAIDIRYVKKENGGLYTCYNTAYETIDTELCVCIDSDDLMPDDAVEIILNEWDNRGCDKYAGIIGLDFDYKSKTPIGGWFPHDMQECYFPDLYTKKIHIGDTKPVMRTDIMRTVSPMTGYPGEKSFNPVYMLLKVCDIYPMLVVNHNLCYVDYQKDDSMSANIFKQYMDSPRSFSKMRLLEMRLTHTGLKNILRVTLHYIATSIIAGDKGYISRSRYPMLTFLLIPFGFFIFLYIRHKAAK